MIEMKVANPDCVEIGPVKFFLGQAVRNVGTDVEQDRAAVSFQPVARRRATRMRYRSAGTEDDEFHCLFSLPQRRRDTEEN